MTIFVIKLLNTFLPIFHIVATIDYGLYFLKDDPFFEKTLRFLLSISISFHIIYTILRSITFKHFPIASVFELLSILALAIVLIYFYIECKIGVKSTGFFVLIMVFLFQTLSSANITYSYEIKSILRSTYVVIHSGTAAFGYSAFSIAALYGIMYLMLFHDIKSKHFGIIYKRLPSLETLDEMNYKASYIGLFFLTLSLIAGGIWLSKAIHQRSIFDPKIIVAIITWIIFGISCAIKKFWGRGGIITSYLSFFGFMVIIFSMIIVNIFLTTFHIFY
ncbi:MAG TPA: hypothetical protein EYP53_05000 [Candidatus Latescibacteria bacterium]|nr:hypothetical protein [Candidatus Latescibacterota bacterium]